MNLDNGPVVDVIYGVGFLLFFGCLLVGAVTTLRRFAYYQIYKFRRPRLLTRDLTMTSGFAVSFGVILIARVLGATNLRDNVAWALITTVPPVVAVAVYAYFEIAVIERPGPRSDRDATHLVSPDGSHLGEPE